MHSQPSAHPGFKGLAASTRRGLPIVAALMFVGCDSVSPPASTFTVRDSAGVQIVESTAPVWALGEAWAVSRGPAVHIGMIDGPEEYQFTTISGVWRVADGGFVVADVRAEQVRFFDAGGIFRGSFGRQGGGPGEFQRLSAAYPYRGDSIAAWGWPRFSVFDRDGRFGRSLNISLTPPRPTGGVGPVGTTRGGLTGVFPDGALLVSPGIILQGNPGQRILLETTFLHYSAEGDSLRSIGSFRGSESLMPDFSGGGVSLGAPFPRRVVRFPGRDGLYVGASSVFEVQRFLLDGVLDRVIRASHRSLALTEEHRDTFEDFERERLAESASPEELERALAAVEFPETVPPYSQILVDSEDHLWVRDYKIRGTPGPEVWSVFAPEGQLLGTLETPERLQVRQIGADFILGIWTDELEVSYVRMYGLERGGSV